MDAAIAADMHLPAAVDATTPKSLHGRLGAVARAAGDGELDLVRVPGAPRHLLQRDAHAGAVLGAEPAPFRADAGLHRAQRLAVGVAGDHAGRVQVAPHRRQVLAACTPSRSMRWPPVTLTVGIANLSTTSAMARSSAALVTPPHMRGTTEIGAVLLDVGVHPLVDEAGLRVVAVFAGPGAQQVVVQRRPARRAQPSGVVQPSACITAGIVFSSCADDLGADRVVAERGALAHRLLARPAPCSRRRAPASSSSSTSGVQLPQDADALVCARTASSVVRPLLGDRAGDRALADAVAAADLGRVGHRRQRPRSGRRPTAAIATSWPKISVSRRSPSVLAVACSRSKYQPPSRASPIQHGADQPVARAAPAAGRRRAPGRGTRPPRVPSPPGEIAGREHVDPGHLQPRPGDAARHRRVSATPVIASAQTLRHVPDRRHQAVGLAAMLDALADREDRRVAGAHLVVDDDAALDVEPDRLRQRRRSAGCRPPSPRGRPAGRVPSASSTALDPVLVAAHRLGVGAGQHRAMPRRSRSACSIAPAAASSCRSISVVHQVDARSPPCRCSASP